MAETSGSKGKKGLVCIGVGLPRTGTLSTAKALSKVLKCESSRIYHGMQLAKQTDQQLDFWLLALNGQVSVQDWHDFFKDYSACLDLPAILFYQDLISIFPEAKVILTIRDPESWYASWHNSIAKSLEVIGNPPYKWFIRQDEKVIQVHTRARNYRPPWCSMSLSEAFESMENARAFYHEWISEVRRIIPSDRLLEFDVTRSGWAALCQFLDLPIPDDAQEFPRCNEAALFCTKMDSMKAECWQKILCWIAVGAAGIFIIIATLAI